MCTIHSNLPAPYPLTRYVGSAAIIEAIKTAALAAPERYDATDRHPRTLPNGAYSLPKPEQREVILDDGRARYEWFDAHGPVAPEPERIHADKVSILYRVGDVIGRYTLLNTREGLTEWADKLRSKSAAFDGKPKRARLPSKARTGGSAAHITAKDLLADGDALGAFTLAQTIGPVYFGQPANLYIGADHVDLAGHGFTIGRNIRTGRFRVLHARTGLAVDSRADHGRSEGFGTHTAALDWIETQTSEPDFLGKLAIACASREDFSQLDAQARFLNPDAQNDGTAAPVAPEACADAMAPETAIDAPTAPIAADARRVQDMVARFYQNHLSGAPGCTVSADALSAEASHLRARAEEFAEHAPQSAATYRAVAAEHEASAERKRASNIASAWNDGARAHVPSVIPWETSAAVYRTHCITSRLAQQVGTSTDGLRARGVVRIGRYQRGQERSAEAQDLRNRVALAMRARRNYPAPVPATTQAHPLPAISEASADPVPGKSDPVPTQSHAARDVSAPLEFVSQYTGPKCNGFTIRAAEIECKKRQSAEPDFTFIVQQYPFAQSRMHGRWKVSRFRPVAMPDPVPTQAQTSREWFAGIQARIDAKRANAEDIAQRAEFPELGGGSVRFRHATDATREALAGPDVSEPGMFRVTILDAYGPVSHACHRTLVDAILAAQEMNYVARTDAIDPVPVNSKASADPVPGKFKVCVTLNSGRKVNACDHYPAAFKSEYATPSDAAAAAHASGLLVNLTVNPVRATRKAISVVRSETVCPADPVSVQDRPLASAGLTSYRCKGRYGWIMIGARDHDDAMLEARRSSESVLNRDGLQVWDGAEYVDAYPVPAKPDVQADGPGERDFDADESEPAPLDGLEVSDFGTLDDVPEFADSLPAKPDPVPVTPASMAQVARAVDVARTLADAIDAAAPDASTRARLLEIEARRVASAAESIDFTGVRSVYRAASTMLALKGQMLRDRAQTQPLPALTVPAAVRRIGPAIAVPRFDPRIVIPARFAPVYMLRG